MVVLTFSGVGCGFVGVKDVVKVNCLGEMLGNKSKGLKVAEEDQRMIGSMVDRLNG